MAMATASANATEYGGNPQQPTEEGIPSPVAESSVRRRAAPRSSPDDAEGKRGAKWADASSVAAPPRELEPRVSYSSGVAFYPPSDKYWRIGGKWYDFADFLPRHPGGAEVLELLRDRFEDCTFAFEAHHLNYGRARKIIQKYEVPESKVRADGLRRRPTSGASGVYALAGHQDRHLDAGETPRLLDDDAFYSVLRRRVAAYLKAVARPSGGPTFQCQALFWSSFVSWACSYCLLLYSGTFPTAVWLGLSAAWLGAFGHNWVHQPKYKFWAYLSLDTLGFSSDGWFREHNLQHHMYTNTPWDNHFEGIAPFLVTDPTVERNWLQSYVMPYVNPFILSFGLYGNYIFNLTEMMKGNEIVTPWKLLLPLEIGAMAYRWGWRGLVLMYASHAVLCVYYFTIALMNHNTESCHDVKKRNESQDWGEAQLSASADWSVGMPFWRAGVYLWLNYHAVHHLFPLVDFSHHPAIQKILIDTCAEFGIDYIVLSPWKIYKEMVHSFSTPLSLMQEITVYGGGI